MRKATLTEEGRLSLVHTAEAPPQRYGSFLHLHPPEPTPIDATPVVEFDAFGFEEDSLEACGQRIEPAQGDLARVIDDAPPRHIASVGKLAQGTTHAPGGTGPTEERGDTTVADHAARRDASHHFVDPVGEIRHGSLRK